MPPPPLVRDFASMGRQGWLVWALLCAAGLAGNHFNFPLFLNVDFLFGSIFALLALQRFGLVPGVLAALVISSDTLLLWNHPYAIVMLTAEVAVVGWLVARWRLKLVVADALYWVALGVPLTYATYHLAMDVPMSSVSIIMVKQAMNGVTNALAARLLFMAFQWYRRTTLLSIGEFAYTLMAACVLVPAMTLLAMSARADFRLTDMHIRQALSGQYQHTADVLGRWERANLDVVTYLAAQAASESTPSMQARLEQAVRSDADFLRIGLADASAVTVAYHPLADENGVSNIGIDFSNRAHVPVLKATLKPMLSDVVMSRVGQPAPIVSVLAPVVRNGAFAGYVGGILRVEVIQAILGDAVAGTGTLYTVLDKNQMAILSNRPGQTMMRPLVRGPGALERIDDTVSQWIAQADANRPIMERWKQSFYVRSGPVVGAANWTVVLEQPVAPFQQELNESYARKLAFLGGILLVALGLAHWLSGRITAPLNKLSALTRDLPDRIAASRQEVDLPATGLVETDGLAGNFRAMGAALSARFLEVRQANETLEERVRERTADLGRSERFALAVLNSVPAHIAVIDQEGSIVAMSQAWLKFSQDNGATAGVPPRGTQVGANYLAACSGEKAANEGGGQASDGIVSVLRGHASRFNLEYPCHSPDTRRWFLMTATPVALEDGPGAVITHIDITERKLLEEAQKEALERLQRIASQVPGVVYQYLQRPDGSACFPYASEGIRQIYGVDPADVKDDASRVFDLLEPADLDRVAQSIQDSAQNLTPWHCEYRLKAQGGEQRWLLGDAAPQRQADGGVLWHGYISDITQRKAVEAELSLHREHLEELVDQRTQELAAARLEADQENVANSRFLATMSHEIRTPMNAIIGFSYLAEGKATDPKQIDWLQKTARAGKHLLAIINDILDFSKIEAGGMVLQSKQVDLRVMLEQVLAMLDEPARAKGLRLTLAMDPMPTHFLGDATRLLQSILNLANNAVKFTERGEVSIHALMQEETATTVTVRFEVRDTGTGVPPEKRDQLFKPFQQLGESASSTAGGTGLGLVITQRLAQLMGGDAGFSSREGQGSTFWFSARLARLPRAETAVRPVRMHWGETLKAHFAGLRVLVVEDDPGSQEVASGLLEAVGLVAEIAQDGEQVIERIKADGQRYAVILMDMSMPRMGGVEATRALRAMGVRTPIIAVTANAFDEDRDQCLQAGMNDFLVKPVEAPLLYAALAKWLQVAGERAGGAGP